MKNIKLSLLLIIAVCVSSMASFAEENHMEAALQHLREARAQVEKAVYGKPGQKEKSLELIDAAIHHLEEARK